MSITALRGAALHALAGEGQGLLVGAVGDRQALHADGQSGVVHHREHAGHAAVFLVEEVDGQGMVFIKWIKGQVRGNGQGGSDNLVP